MSWIQENKFVAGLAGITAVMGGVILYIGNSQSNEYEEKIAEYQRLADKFRNLQKSKPFPSKNNLQVREESIAAYEGVINDVGNTFNAFQAGKTEKLSPSQFGKLRVKMDKELRESYNKAGIVLPENTAFGFEKYKSALPKPQATQMLKYELDAAQWLLTQLAVAKPTELNSIRRHPLDVENGKAVTTVKSRRGGARKGVPAQSSKAYTLMPMEIAFTGSESSMRDFLQSMVNSKEYFFSIRALRIRNEKQTPPSVKDANFPANRVRAVVPGDDNEADPFAGIALPGPDGDEVEIDPGVQAVPDPAPQLKTNKGERILMQILGDEKIHVFIRFDVVYIQEKAKTK